MPGQYLPSLKKGWVNPVTSTFVEQIFAALIAFGQPLPQEHQGQVRLVNGVARLQKWGFLSKRGKVLGKNEVLRFRTWGKLSFLWQTPTGRILLFQPSEIPCHKRPHTTRRGCCRSHEAPSPYPSTIIQGSTMTWNLVRSYPLNKACRSQTGASYQASHNGIVIWRFTETTIQVRPVLCPVGLKHPAQGEGFQLLLREELTMPLGSRCPLQLY